MPAEEAFQLIQKDLRQHHPFNVVLASRRFGEEEDEIRRLNLGDELQRDFEQIARDAIALQGDVRLIAYQPGYKPDQGEVVWLDLARAPLAAAVVERISNFQNLVMFQQSQDIFMNHLQYYALRARINPERRLVFFRKASPKLELGRGRKIAAMFSEGHYDRVQESVFLFDRDVDCLSDGHYLFIFNVNNFERMFRYFEDLRRRAAATVDQVMRRVPIANAQEFRQACTTQVRFMTKLAVIASKPYLANIGMEAINCSIRENELPIVSVMEDGVEKLVFDPEPSRRWILLKLLDDDYLTSVMTELKYEVNSKIPRI
jgi:hypothetical protein